ncbi:MAG: NAD(P)H-dependent oxidoreductase subunit E [Methylococcaceae bacterium]|jgi:[NiFe] hydrogenase diaphorase moiety large subunit|nr:NAD(P)H-dependent oxidoreductase subunit E [Methylococcaceae bacterium]MDD1636516.1 NAD(P)H-dependent oxidoreductase subunit E [Methylococcaceae bacterium]MDD1642073.1 NAD(P)H-dependent oxidoreductase subunit E [Methylococcaceae bacterium]OYV19504.1 MAG: hydrogen dehydrogenase [Methylococcaceae bacterium NSM2-1]
MKQFIQDLAETNRYQATHLLHILRGVQSRFHYIPEQAIEQIAELLKISRTQIIGVIEFYSFFHLKPRGQYELLISDSITDHMLGKQSLINYLSEKLTVAVGEVRQDGVVSLDNTSCTGMCDQGPAGLVNGYALTRLDRTRIDQITDLINQQKPLDQWPGELFQVEDNIIEPGLLLSQSINQGSALQSAFKRGLKETLIELDKSGLRGRGGAGFKTATKWKFCSEEQGNQRYVICNADEGEPGTFKDRVLLNSYAHRVFEGMTLCAAIIGAQQGFLYLRGEYLHLYDKLQSVLDERRQAGFLGNNILKEGLNFDIEICLGAGAYICGEESALIESLEGKMGIPRNRPPYPVTQGYLGKPTVVNNVETFIAAASIAVKGGDWFANVGTEKSKGTKILSICGDCSRPGIYEYPFGTSIQSVLNDCGARDVLGIQIGGPSGTFISNKEFDRKLAFEDLATGGSFIVFNNSRNILDIVNNFTHFFAHESCGFCTPCRVGTALLKKQLDKIVEGHGSAGDVVALEELCQLIKTQSHCGLGQTAANPVLTTLERYPELYQSQLKNISYEPGFDLDGALETARRLAKRNDAGAHLAQVEE